MSETFESVFGAELAARMTAPTPPASPAVEIAIAAMKWTDERMIADARKIAQGERFASYGYGGDCFLSGPQASAFSDVLKGVSAALAAPPTPRGEEAKAAWHAYRHLGYPEGFHVTPSASEDGERTFVAGWKAALRASHGAEDDDLEDDIAEALDDSMDVEWTSKDGARHVMGLLRNKGLIK